MNLVALACLAAAVASFDVRRSRGSKTRYAHSPSTSQGTIRHAGIDRCKVGRRRLHGTIPVHPLHIGSHTALLLATREARVAALSVGRHPHSSTVSIYLPARLSIPSTRPSRHLPIIHLKEPHHTILNTILNTPLPRCVCPHLQPTPPCCRLPALCSPPRPDRTSLLRGTPRRPLPDGQMGRPLRRAGSARRGDPRRPPNAALLRVASPVEVALPIGHGRGAQRRGVSGNNLENRGVLVYHFSC